MAVPSATAKRDENAIKMLSFNDPAFIQHFGLNAMNILDYFYPSPFYDPSSCNQGLRMQGASLENMKTMKGIQYIHESNPEAEPQLFKVKKVYRESPTTVKTLEVYYCLEGTFYQAPDLFDVVSTRTKKVVAHMREGFSTTLRGHGYSAGEGHVSFAEGDKGEDAQELLDLVGFPSITSLLRDIKATADLPQFQMVEDHEGQGKEDDNSGAVSAS